MPPEYQDLYSTLQTQIAGFNSAVSGGYNGDPGWNGTSYPVLYSAALPSADSSQFTNLLNTSYYSATVTPQLQGLQALGAKAVTVHISFPILYQPYYSTNPSEYQSFVSFYQQLAQDVHNRGMKLIVETVTMEDLAGTQGGMFGSYYASLSWNDYMNGRAQNAVNVAQQVQPDYMSVITEPDKESNDSGQANAGTPSGSLQMLQTILTALQTAGVKNVQIGAGAGTWTASFTTYLQNFGTTSINYIDTHIYPINENYFLNLLSAADTIHATGKQAAITEAWPQKIRDSELGSGTLTPTDVDARSAFSFWAPIDRSFLNSLVNAAQYKQLMFISPSWTTFYFAYLDYNTYGTLDSSDVLNDAYQAASTASNSGTFTSTGHNWETLTIPAPDTTPPSVPPAPTALSVGSTNANLTWGTSTDNVGVANYRLYRNGVWVTSESTPGYYDTSLSPGGTYLYVLQAVDASGNASAVSAPLTVTTINTIPPTTPTNLQVTGTTSSSVSLKWCPSTDTGGPIAGYRVMRGSSSTSMSTHATTTGTTYTDPGVYPSTTYYYAVIAYISTGYTSPQSAVVKATTASSH